MVTRQVTIKNRTGLHARPASNFVLEAKKYESKIQVRRLDSEAVNAKSIVMLLAEGLTQGTEIEIIADGADEELAVGNLVMLIESGLGE